MPSRSGGAARNWRPRISSGKRKNGNGWTTAGYRDNRQSRRPVPATKVSTDGLATHEQEGAGHRIDGGNRIGHRIASGSGGGVGGGERSLEAAGRAGRRADSNAGEKRPGDGCIRGPRHEGRRKPAGPRGAGRGYTGEQ